MTLNAVTNVCGQCGGSGQTRRYEPVSRNSLNPDSDYVRFVGWQVCPFCGGDGLSPVGKRTHSEDDKR